MTCLYYRNSRLEHRVMTWHNYITITSQNKHWGTIHKIYKWIHSEVTITSTFYKIRDRKCQRVRRYWFYTCDCWWPCCKVWNMAIFSYHFGLENTISIMQIHRWTSISMKSWCKVRHTVMSFSRHKQGVKV